MNNNSEADVIIFMWSRTEISWRTDGLHTVVIGEQTVGVERIRLGLPATLVVPIKSLPAAPLLLIKLPQQMKPVKTITINSSCQENNYPEGTMATRAEREESLLLAGDGDDRRLGVRLAHLVPPSRLHLDKSAAHPSTEHAGTAACCPALARFAGAGVGTGAGAGEAAI
uniref:Uncharacterized protein n=1 Tax=Leersia perrieri TaxID=77586 RepID=A0A0D9V9N7_9ORYZ